jgi:hypothetical protein
MSLMSGINPFEEYKFFIEDTARFSERRQTISNIYIAVNSLLLTAVGLLVKDLAIQSFWSFLLPIPLILAGIAASLLWSQLIYRYKELIRFRIKTLRKMEEGLENSIKMYHLEDELYPVDEKGSPIPGKGLNLSDIEVKLPNIFIGLYIIFGIALLFAFVNAKIYKII